MINQHLQARVLLYIVFIFCSSDLYAQSSLEAILFQKKLSSERQISGVYKIENIGNKTSVIRYPNPESNISEMIIYGKSGNELAKVSKERIKRVSFSEFTSSFIVISGQGISDKVQNSFFDENGIKTLDLTITDPGLTMSDDGKYGITTQVSIGENKGYFRVFDLSTGEEVQTPINRYYYHFFARYIDDERVVVLVQNFNRVKNENFSSRSLFDKKSSTPKSKRQRREELSAKRKKEGPPYIVTPKAMKLIIYNIPRNTIEVQRDLFSTSGDPFWMIADNPNVIIIDKKLGQMFLVLSDENLQDNPFGRPQSIIKVSLNGEIDWESKKFEAIRNIGIVAQNKIIVLSEPKLITLLNTDNGQEVWQYGHKNRYTNNILSISVLNDNILLQTTHISNWKLSDMYLLNIDSGINLLPTNFDFNQILINTTSNNSTIFDKQQSKLLFLE